jgi:hypothetical protein
MIVLFLDFLARTGRDLVLVCTDLTHTSDRPKKPMASVEKAPYELSDGRLGTERDRNEEENQEKKACDLFRIPTITST